MWSSASAPAIRRSATEMRRSTGSRPGVLAAGAENAKIHPAVAPLAGEIVVTKHRVSAFAGTDLDLMLRANGIETLILTGIVTSGVVLSTLRHAADADYRLWSSAIAALTATR